MIPVWWGVEARAAYRISLLCAFTFILYNMDIRRSVTCSFWMDDWVEQLNPSQKLLFLYLLTNPSSNILGIYKISFQRMSFETGLDRGTIEKALKGFESVKKVFYYDGYIILANHLKHQSLNTNMKVNVYNDYKELPNSLKDRLNINALKDFESLSKGLATLRKIEIEIEIEREIEIGDFDFEKFWNLYNKKVGDKKKIESKWIRLKQDDRDKIFKTLPLFLESIKDKQYQPYPETYLNNRRWEDEIIEKKPEIDESKILPYVRLGGVKE